MSHNCTYLLFRTMRSRLPLEMDEREESRLALHIFYACDPGAPIQPAVLLGSRLVNGIEVDVGILGGPRHQRKGRKIECIVAVQAVI